MRIIVFGAAGNVGSCVLKEGLSRGHELTGAVRDVGQAIELPAETRVVAGDAADPGEVARLSADQDLVVAATRPAPGRERDHITTAMALLKGVRRSRTRLLLVGGAGSLTAPDTGRRIVDDPRYVSPAWRDIAVACCDQYDFCQAETEADWTYLSPPALLESGRRTGHYRIGGDELILDPGGRSRISIEDLAVALLDEAEQPKHRRARFTVAY